ncbi:pyridoxal-phosphate dependent enzyme family protein, partial [Vibrio parahaemolyticus V-223/04]
MRARIQQALSNTDWRVRYFFMRFVMGGLVLKPL